MSLIAILQACLASTTLASVLPLGARDATPQDVTHSLHHISEFPTIDWSRRVANYTHKPDFSSLSGHSSQPHIGEHTHEKRVPLSSNFRITQSDPLVPLHNQAPVPADCQRVCDYLTRYTSPKILGPLEIEEYTIGHCTFAMVNLQPCHTVEMSSLLIPGTICSEMYAQYAMYGYDGYAEGVPPYMGFSLYGEAAAPAYEERLC